MRDHWRLEKERLDEVEIRRTAKQLLGIVFALGASMILLMYCGWH